MDHPSACDMMRWPPCFMESILHEWKAVICRDVNETSYIFVILVCQSKRPLQWSPVHWMDHSAVCDMMRGPPSFFLSILHQWKAEICIILTVHHVQYMCNLSASVKAVPVIISSALNGTSGCLWYAGLQQYIIYSGLKNRCHVWGFWTECNATLDIVESCLALVKWSKVLLLSFPTVFYS